MLLRHAGVVVVVADTGVDRQVLDRPLVLRVQADLLIQILPTLERRDVLGDRSRHTVEQRVLDVAVDVAGADAVAEKSREAEFQRMRARDIRQRRTDVVRVVVVLGTEAGAEQQAGRLLGGRDGVGRHLWLQNRRLMEHVGLGAGFEQQAAGERRAPGHLPEYVHDAPLLNGGLGEIVGLTSR